LLLEDMTAHSYDFRTGISPSIGKVNPQNLPNFSNLIDTESVTDPKMSDISRDSEKTRPVSNDEYQPYKTQTSLKKAMFER
jgi:hypothetical protein